MVEVIQENNRMNDKEEIESADSIVAKVTESVEYIRGRLTAAGFGIYAHPRVAIICGSGLGNLSSRLENPFTIAYSEIPGFPKATTVKGHGSGLAFGMFSAVPAVFMTGRFHFYEGHDLKAVAFPVRVLAQLGIDTLVVTNSAGSVDPSFNVGDIMVINDHLSFLQLAGLNPLRGENITEWGPRFVSLTNAYLKDGFDLVKAAAADIDMNQNLIRQGVYCCVGGPAYETRAEIRMMRAVGGSAVGMSTIPEVTVAVHSGVPRILALSLITNKCIADEVVMDNVAPTHEEVLETAANMAIQMESLMIAIVRRLYSPK